MNAIISAVFRDHNHPLSVIAIEEALTQLNAWPAAGANYPLPCVLVVSTDQASFAYRLWLSFDKVFAVVIDHQTSGMAWGMVCTCPSLDDTKEIAEKC